MSEERRRYLRDMLDELDRHFDEFERSVEEAVKASVNTGQRAFSRPVVTGMAMGFGPEGKPRIQFFGDNLIGPDGFRSPIYEQVVDEKEGTLRLVFELPGIEKEDVEISALEEKVTLEAVKEERRYRTEVLLQRAIDPDSGTATYRNGLLEVAFKLRDNTNKGYRRVTVD
ncbi:MAG: Hsp20 family protein [Nitrososphaerales archaeon]